jgi:hypothetical protein
MLPVTVSPPSALGAATEAKHGAAGIIEVELESARVVVRGPVEATVLRAVFDALLRR